MSVHRKGRSGVRLSLIIIAIVFFSVIVSFVLSTAIGYDTQKRSLTENTLELNRITANELSRTTETIVQSMQDTLKSASDYISSGQWKQEDIQQQIDFLRNSVPYFNSVVIVNESGLVTSTSPEALKLKGTTLSSQQAMEALQQKKPMISEPYRASTGRLIILASYPVYNIDGSYKGFIGGSVYLQEKNVFQKILGQQGMNENGSYYYVVDSEGNLIYHPDASRIGENVSNNAIVQLLIEGKDGQMKVKNSRNASFLAGAAVIPAVGWGIVSQTPSSVISDSVEEVIVKVAMISTPLMLVLLLIVIFISHRLSFPLNRLAHLASNLTKGAATTVRLPDVKHWNYETNELYCAVSEAFKLLDKRAEEFSYQAHTDPLTGLTNRRLMDEIVARWVREGVPFAVIMMDLDRFKSINDTYGHQMGDEVLRFLAAHMQQLKGKNDYCCRYGGEEFVFLMPYGSESQAYEIAEKLRSRMANENSPTGKPVTLSLGISSYPLQAQSVESLFGQADDALYRAKKQGRNRTIVYDEAAATSEED
ncbi:sensor domain-containing diguanylate cyclase [Cohnella sp. AR92]|uniref:sensor domain-containing diguanylate cyclase n=1 Tax=Cohnella sp. AR92 TaxID=648716 RepID=UPI0013159930|nr:sensor domain-containing diguanylate cyclase [Cohnella sp. AR92]